MSPDKEPETYAEAVERLNLAYLELKIEILRAIKDNLGWVAFWIFGLLWILHG